MLKPFIKDRVFIPASQVNTDDLATFYETRLYDDNKCQKCPSLPERHCEVCDMCPNYLGHVRLWNEETVKNHLYYAVPAGHLKRVQKRLGVDLSNAEDLRKRVKMRSKLRWKGALYDGKVVDGEEKPNQVELVQRWLAKDNGLIKAPPRTGKTVLGVYIVCKKRERALITASQSIFLRQFCKRFGENTNCRKIKRKYGRSPVLLIDPSGWDKADKYGVDVARSWKEVEDELDNYDVVLSTYQQFIHPRRGRKRIRRYIRRKFSLLVIDEVHQANALAFSRVVNRIDCRSKLGLTATPKRKDGLEFVVRDVVGPIVAEGKTTSLKPNIELWETGIGAEKKYNQWWRMERYLVDEDRRNRQIVRQVFKDLRANKLNSILIPVNRLAHIKKLVKMINTQAKINNFKRGEDWQIPLAIPYRRGIDSEHIVQQVEKYHCRVVVAVSRMIKYGWDVQAWTHVYTGLTPTNNGPQFYQQANRVATPRRTTKELKVPIVRHVVDAMPVSLFCFKGLFFNEIIKNLRDKPGKPSLYRMRKEVFDRALEIAKFPRAYSFQDATDDTRRMKPIKAF